MDYTQQAMYPPSHQPDLDAPYLPQPEASHPSYEHQDGMESAEHSGYELFPGSAHNASYANRYRSNSTSTHGYSQAGDSVYSHSSFADSVPSFGGSDSYGMMGSLPSSYGGSGKVSPVTPGDPAGGMHHGHPYGPDKPYSNGHPEAAERHMHGYPSRFAEDFPMGGVNNGLPFQSLQQFSDRRYPADNHYSGGHSLPSHMSTQHGVAPTATNGSLSSYDDRYMGSGQLDSPMRPMSGSDDPLRMKMQPLLAAPSDFHAFIRCVALTRSRTSNRLAFGERSVIVMSSKVAQKSYGTEKRFLCPPPTCIMIGNSWWTDVMRQGEEPKSMPPRVVVSISGETQPPEGAIEWTSASGKSFESSDPPTGTTYIGRCVGKQLYISDVDEKRKKVEALAKIIAPGADDEPEHVIGCFPSRPIKVISKPSKKRQSAKNLELCINHGSTISLFHRLRSQTVSTKYLCVSGSGSSFKGSDGAALMGLDQRSRATTPSFVARTASWDPFVLYIVDVSKPSGGIDAPPPPPPQSDYPSPPPNAIPFSTNGSQIPVYYNQTVVLQCLTSGVVSPVLIIRKIDHQTTVVGGGLQGAAKGIPDNNCVPGEVCGDPVSQLHKVAFEVYDASKATGPPEHGLPGDSGAFLSCMGEKVNTYRPIDGRQWISPDPGSPVVSSPGASGGEGFAHVLESGPPSPNGSDYVSNDGGRVKKKRSTSSAGMISTMATPAKRRRPSSAGSVGSRRGGSGSDPVASSGAMWQVDIGETSVWTIVGVDQIRYNFYVPPVLYDQQHKAPAGSFPVPSKAVTPFPNVVKYLPPDRASELPKHHSAARNMLQRNVPPPNKLLTVYGENFTKTDPLNIFFGADPSPYVEVRCTEVLGCLPPENTVVKRRPIVTVRSDGVMFPSSVMYP
ncbi:hypothetical protein BD626DRAFT_473612 [Schizophyllum amplum]|uniref:LAG1-DNAbind-domain-containing protein n=1 Tax=Schizophyllum amplum TaxID=97359 RepID=A0A550CWY7_9AGAR|nr:hypothetical protein BD626DRAFT_473612 [Auriculariopsis ampla]